MEDKYKYFSKTHKVYMFIITILICIIFLYSKQLSGILAIVYFVMEIYNIKKYKDKKQEWGNIMENFSSKIDEAIENARTKLPFPLIIIDNKGDIVWYNDIYSSKINKENCIGKNINYFIKNINVKKIIEGKINVVNYVKIKDKYYNVYINLVKDKENLYANNIALLYFYDVTDKFFLEQNMKDKEEAIILIEVDNLEEVLKTTEEDKKPLLAAEIERNINSYAQNMDAMIKKYASNKYVLVVERKYVKREAQRKFDILDKIRDLNIGNKLSATLSIGVGIEGKTPMENNKYAMSAIELALGRGGDQAIIKSKENLSFYGGSTKEFEKRTKVRARVIAQALVDLINESKNVIIMGHINPDIDCLGSAIGISSVVRKFNIPCNIVLENINTSMKAIINKLIDLEEYKNIFINENEAKGLIKDNTLLILVDVHNKSYVESIELINKCERIVIVDHHRKSWDFIEKSMLTYMEPYASSTSELVTEMLQYMTENPKLKTIEAEALLAGICVDTKNFSFKTGVRTFEAAAFLRKLGADTVDVKKLFSDSFQMYLKKIDIIRAAKVKNGIAIAINPIKIEDNLLAAQAADELLNITEIKASFVISQIETDVYISGRSLGDINVQVILEELGGGGHMTMAGARLKNTTPEEVEKMLIKAIDKNLEESEEI